MATKSDHLKDIRALATMKKVGQALCLKAIANPTVRINVTLNTSTSLSERLRNQTSLQDIGKILYV